MANAIVSWVNRVDQAAVSGGPSASAALPVSNVQRPVVREFWRAGGTVCWLRVDFGRDVPLRVLALAQPTDGPLLAATDTVRHRLDGDGGTAGMGALFDSGAVASGIQAGRGVHAHLLAGEIQARYWQVDVAAQSLAGVGAVDIGRLWAGPAWQPEVNFAYGASSRWVDLGSVARGARSGVPYCTRGGRLRARTLPFDRLGPADRLLADDFLRTVGSTRQFFLWPDPADPAEAMLALLQEVPELVQRHYGADAATVTALEHP